MRVIKRDGTPQPVSFDKILNRIQYLCDGLHSSIDPMTITQKVIARIYDGVTTSELDEVSAGICYNLSTEHLDYGILATRIIISNMHKNTSPSFSEVITQLYQYTDEHGNPSPIISDEIYTIVSKNKEKLNSILKYDRDYLLDYFGFKTMERSYLFKINGRTMERPQHMFLRVALGIHKDDIRSAIETYEWMSQKAFIHATPTLFHAGTNHPQLLSCFLLGTGDSIDGIFKTMSDCAKISKWAGGIGLHINNIRSKGSKIYGTNGTSNGIVPMLRTYNSIARYINQSGKRPGSIAIYLEPHHPEILEFLDLKKNHGAEEERTRDLFLSLWLSDLFMERVEKAEMWSLMDSKQCPNLDNLYGDEYRTLYEQYEKEGKYIKQIPARTVWTKILSSQIETGVPYLLFKDAANRKSNQKNIGTIKSSNLCVAPETMILTREYGNCPISSVVNQGIHVWNGEEWSFVVPRQTSENAELIKIECSNGSMLECTKEHVFYVEENQGTIRKLSAIELQPGMKLIPFKLPYVSEKKLTADQKKWILDILQKCSIFMDSVKNEKVYIHSDYAGLQKVRIFLMGYGILSRLRVVNGATYLHFSAEALLHCEVRLGFSLFGYSEKEYYDLSTPAELLSIEVEHVTQTGRQSPTYCFTEIKRNRGVFNGLLTGQCAEILEYSDDQEYACCTLASIGLPFFVQDGKMDWSALEQVVGILVKNLNKVIDINRYPVPETEKSNKRHRPIGMGVQGFADFLLKQRIAFDSEEAKKVNLELFEFIYYHALKMSCQLAKEHGAYETFVGSPASQGLLQFDLWSVEPIGMSHPAGPLDWMQLKKEIQTYGLRNSLLLALMPTATTSQILGYNEAFEPYTSNIYTRRTIAGDFVIMNSFLMKDLMNLGLWSKEMKDKIIASSGSIQSIPEIPAELKNLYRTAWEMKQRVILDLAADRGRYICQTQSMNLFFEDPSMNTLTNAHMYGWKKGLKTGVYYVRTRPKAQAVQVTLDPTLVSQMQGNIYSDPAPAAAAFVCSRDNPNCEACSS